MRARKLLDIALKDLMIIGKDRAAWILLLITPILIIMVASFALAPAFEGNLKSQLLVNNLDQGEGGSELTQRLLEIEGLEVVEASRAQVESLTVADGKYRTGLIIPEDFTARITKGQDVSLVVYVDPTDNAQRPFMVGIIDGVSSRLSGMVSSVRLAVEEVEKFAPGTDQSAVIADAAPKAVAELSGEPAVNTEIINASGFRDVNMFDTQAPGYAVMFLLFGVMMGAELLLEERDKGTLGRLMVAPISRASILGGKVAAQFVIAIIQMAILFGVGHFIFGMSLGNSLPALAVMIVVTAFTATSFGLLMAGVSRTRRQAASLGTLVIILMSALGGSWWPLEIVPDFMQIIGHATINAWALDGINGLILKGEDFSSILQPAAVLLLYGAVCYGIGLKMFRFRSG